ncbi:MULTISPECIES: carbohydrate ABC transporter permease [unclassified Paenibacillus]|uniref:carbohydrate ABC transporter permease n=1 Tax=unclassified Paenibacillus TaxID=185978 RepID=UPI001C11B940|nr:MULTISPECIES: sugar ABC transporter permease [unclassified Paenibacillus]MBU5443913.1 sugar ABC transporter permease [Paenibacillus sp. MSJ-34]CAH0121206.1 Melibiose/raffinose/stachyose import permease protein MelD [Paenibacillus sp. CECT 9249]
MNRGKPGIGNLMHQWVFVGPALLFFAVIVIIPFLMNIYYSFTEWNGISSNMNFIGFDNYKHIIMNDTDFRNAFWFTIRFSVAEIVLTNVVGFALALLLTQALKSKNVLRTVFFMPNVIGGLLLGFIWQFIFVKGFSAIGEATGWGFFELPWLGDAPTAFWGIVIVAVWQGAGYLMIIYIAALGNVPKDMLEAATIDGANRWQVLRRITIPLIMPAFTICLFLTISWAFKMFDLNLSLTKGGPFNSTESVALNIYQEAFRNDKYGLGTAKSLIFFVAVALISLIQVAYTKKKEVEV